MSDPEDAPGPGSRAVEPEDAIPTLPPHSGINGPCPKCGSRCARTKWLVKPPDPGMSGTLRGVSKEEAPWYYGYWSGGDPLTVYLNGGWFEDGPAAWWPLEWLGRLCMICGYRWDERLAEQENIHA